LGQFSLARGLAPSFAGESRLHRGLKKHHSEFSLAVKFLWTRSKTLFREGDAMNRRPHAKGRCSARRNPDRIVADLVGEIGSESEAEVRQKIDELGRLTGPLWGNRAANADHIKDVRRRLEQLQKQLDRVPDHVFHLLFTPDFDLPSEQQLAAYEERAVAFTGSLRELSRRCDELLDLKPGAHASGDHLQKQCAVEAKVLLEDRGLPVGDVKPTGKYGRVASLLYEAVTGEPGKSLEWACREVSGIPVVREIGK
jgi:hypothetical protein